MIVGLTVASAVLLPSLSGFRTLSGSSLASSDRRASRWAMLKDGGVQGDGAASEGDAASKSARPQQESGKPEGSGRPTTPNAARQTNGQGRQGGKGGPGRAKSGAPRGQPSSSKGGRGGQARRPPGPVQRSGARGRIRPAGGKRPSPIPGRATSRVPNGTATRRRRIKARTTRPASIAVVPGAELAAHPPILIAGITFLIFGAVRYGPDLLRASGR